MVAPHGSLTGSGRRGPWKDPFPQAEVPCPLPCLAFHLRSFHLPSVWSASLEPKMSGSSMSDFLASEHRREVAPPFLARQAEFGDSWATPTSKLRTGCDVEILGCPSTMKITLQSHELKAPLSKRTTCLSNSFNKDLASFTLQDCSGPTALSACGTYNHPKPMAGSPWVSSLTSTAAKLGGSILEAAH